MAETNETEKQKNTKICCLYRIGDRKKDPNLEIIYLDATDSVTFGRAEDNDVPLTDCLTVSRKHGHLVKTEKGWTIKDLGSGNGIHINHHRIPTASPRLLADRDIVEIGKNTNEEGLAVYTFQFFKKAKIQKTSDGGKSRQPLLSKQNTLNSSEDKKNAVKNALTSPTGLMRQRLVEQERLLREEMQEKEKKRLKEMEEKMRQKEEEQAKALEELRVQREVLQKEMEEQKLKQQAEMEKEKIKFQEELEQQKAEQEKLTAQQREYEERLKQTEDEKVEMEEKLRIEEEKKAKDLEDQLNMEAKLRELEECHQEQLETARKEAKSKMDELEEVLQSREVELEQEKEAIQSKAEETRLKLAAEKEELERKLAEDLENQLKQLEEQHQFKLESEVEEVRGQKRKLEEDLETELNKRLKEKDEEATIELNRKEEELRNLLERKDQEYETLQEQLKAKAKEEIQSNLEDVMENELVCAICSELMVQATSLNCSHSFCHLCITRWQDTKKPQAPCPNCRQTITSSVRSLVLDNYIDKVVVLLKDEVKERRKRLVEERKVEQAQYNKQKELAKRQQQQSQGGARGRGRPTANGAFPLEHYLTQVGNQIYLNTPPNSTATVGVVQVPSTRGQSQANVQAAVQAISPWLQQYLNTARPGTGASPQLTRQDQRTPFTVTRGPLPTTTTSATTRTQTNGLVSQLDQNRGRTDRNMANINMYAPVNANPFAINLQNQRRPGESQNNPIVVPHMAHGIAHTHQAGQTAHHHPNPTVQHGTHRGRPRQTTNNMTGQHNVPTAHVHNGRQTVTRNDNRAHTAATRSTAQRTAQSSRQANRSQSASHDRRGYTQHGNPPDQNNRRQQGRRVVTYGTYNIAMQVQGGHTVQNRPPATQPADVNRPIGHVPQTTQQLGQAQDLRNTVRGRAVNSRTDRRANGRNRGTDNRPIWRY